MFWFDVYDVHLIKMSYNNRERSLYNTFVRSESVIIRKMIKDKIYRTTLIRNQCGKVFRAHKCMWQFFKNRQSTIGNVPISTSKSQYPKSYGIYYSHTQ